MPEFHLGRVLLIRFTEELLPDGFARPHTVTTCDKLGRVVAQETVQFPTPRLAIKVGGSLEIGPSLGEATYEP